MTENKYVDEKLFKMKQDDWIKACQEIDALEKQLSEKEAEIKGLGEALMKIRVAGGMEAELAKCFKLVTDRDEKITSLSQKLEEAEKEIASLTQRESNYLETIGQDTRTIKELRLDIALLEQNLDMTVRALKQLMVAVMFKEPSVVNNVAVYEARVPLEFIEFSEKTLKQIGESDERD